MKQRVLFIALLSGLLFAGCQKSSSGGGDDPQPEPAVYDYYMYGLAAVDIETEDRKPVTSKDPVDYIPCVIKVDGNGVFADYEGTGKIRGRGNSSWEWYDKKPYRIKLDETSPFMGMPTNRDWVLLADFRDPTHLMNNVGFSMAHYMGIPYTNHSRYAEVTLNGEFLGLYMVTEQVEQGGNRVDVEKDGGLLLALDVDDGPKYSKAGDNFWSKVYKTAVCVKWPEDPTADQVADAKAAFAELENAIQNQDYDALCQILDIKSMIEYLIVEELIENVEMNNGESSRSCYISRNAAGLWTMGPVWDCDAGFDFDWSDMYKGHKYFGDYKELIFGTEPYWQWWAYNNYSEDGSYPKFFSDLWGMDEFVDDFKARWNEVRDGMLTEVTSNIDKTYAVIKDALETDASMWEIKPDHSTMVPKLKTWLKKRFAYVDDVINAYPHVDKSQNPWSQWY